MHAEGARHLADPTKLLASAGRLYGQDMDRLWGEIKPVDAARIRALDGGETIAVVGREIRVEYTPGHASHHVSYLDTASRVAFVGDTAGIRRGSGTYVMPPTPPPDIDIEAWRESEKKILAWDPDTLFLTHFGPHQGVRQHLAGMFENLAAWSRIVQRLLADASLSDEVRQRRFTDEVSHNLIRSRGGNGSLGLHESRRPQLFVPRACPLLAEAGDASEVIPAERAVRNVVCIGSEELCSAELIDSRS